MFSTLTVRNFPKEIKEVLTKLAEQSERSLEGEVRHALRRWVEMSQADAATGTSALVRRCQMVAARLRLALEHCNKLRRGSQWTSSQIAREIGESSAGQIEQAFAGELEPTFVQLEMIAAFLGCSSEWLMHGEGQMYVTQYERIPELPAEGVKWLIGFNEATRPNFIHLVREQADPGGLAVVRQYNDRVAKTFLTPYHVSEVIGTGGESSLTYLFVIFELLYAVYTKGGSNLMVKSYLAPEPIYRSLCSGGTHPLQAISECRELPWWEDIWDKKQVKKFNYWDGWQRLSARIMACIEDKKYLVDELDKIRDRSHPIWDELKISKDYI